MTDVKVFGERNTATNALRSIVEKNSASRVLPSTAREIDESIDQRLKLWNRIGRGTCKLDPHFHIRMRERSIDRVFSGRGADHAWKHTATRFERPDSLHGTLVLFCVRNPYSWFLSLFKNPYHSTSSCPNSLEDFLDFDWHLVGRDNLPYRSLTPLQLYEEKLKSYLALMEQAQEEGFVVEVVRFEDIVLRQETVYNNIAAHLEDPAPTFAPLNTSTKSKDKNIDFYKKYYGNELWREEIGPVMPQITRRISKELFGTFSYQL